MADSKTKAFLREHPKLLGVLFGMTMLLSQTGAVAAGNGNSISGI